jgi:vacuolar-type H+-ATPase subunit D/Vma8
MIQRKSQFINSQQQQQDLASTQPWLDDMIGRANEVLNALLRLRKHQLASEQYRLNQQSNLITSDYQRVSPIY